MPVGALARQEKLTHACCGVLYSAHRRPPRPPLLPPPRPLLLLLRQQQVCT